MIRAPFHCDYGSNIRIGAGSFPNFSGVILDVVEVGIGERPQIGSVVQIHAADHPRDPATRRAGLVSPRRPRRVPDASSGRTEPWNIPPTAMAGLP